MRRFVVFVAAVMVFAAAAFGGTSHAARGVMGEARFLPGVRIDGRPSEWGGLNIRLDNGGQCITGVENWQGPGDASGRFGIGYDDRNLYVAGEVRDNKLVNDQSGILMWNGDCVQIFIDADPDSDSGDHAYNRDDFHFGVSPGTDGRRPGWTVWQPPSGRVPLNVAIERTSDGYAFEMAVPLDLLGVKPVPGKGIGFGVTLADSDAPKVVKTQLSTADANAFRDPTVLGRINFR